MTPTQRSLKKLRDEGYTCQVVEHWNPFAKIRQDLYGFIDILAIRENEVLGVQTTDGTSVSKRVKKILAHPNYPLVVSSGILVTVHGWSKNKKTGKYVLREEVL